MKILYIYPHPDDESFGPANVMHKQIREGHEVHLLTLTKGGATKKRFDFNLSIDEMGEVRYKEMLCVERALKLTSMTVLDLPDSGLKEMDPREIEKVIEEHIHKIQPDVIATYAVHGISGFHDHLVSHAVVKNVFCKLREENGYPKRFALVTVDEQTSKESPHFKLNFSKEEEIDCVIEVEEEDMKALHNALDCYKSYQSVIEETKIKDLLKSRVVFELFQENFDPPIHDLFEKLPSA